MPVDLNNLSIEDFKKIKKDKKHKLKKEFKQYKQHYEKQKLIADKMKIEKERKNIKAKSTPPKTPYKNIC